MTRPGMLFVLLPVLVLSACDDDGKSAIPDAPIVVIDAPVVPDAPTCAAPMKMCGTLCAAVATDEANCGDCGVTCHGGEACDGTCACPASFIPAMHVPQQFDMFNMQGALTVGIAVEVDAVGIHPILIGYNASTPLNTDIDVSAIAVGSAPFVAAGYRLDLGTFDTDAGYLARAGTLRFTKACDTEVEGTLTGATFRGVSGGVGSPTVDPLGCSIGVPSFAFHVMTAACP